ncbi:MAG: hypothetical protein A3H35_02365 [Betaproteobacteria bacterium RIFCSPLOWO2_02_FULL_62_17]|nr:MAG: hypothetical protein A3H35_02365 [Betaproteobacteria bacterium RIFCSPLOWO2_02_FULL_62_17]
MNPDDVAQYLQDNPAFFDDYADVLARIQLPHPHGGHAIGLADRQVLNLREKHRALEAKLAELLQFGEENDAISEKMHRLGLALLAASSRDALLWALNFNLREDFAIPHVATRLWGMRPRELDAGAEVYGEVSDELKHYAASLAQPYCGANNNAESARWFGEAAAQVRSAAYIPLRESVAAAGSGACVGMLALGSEDAARFYAEMGTLYLTRLGELASAGLTRFV